MDVPHSRWLSGVLIPYRVQKRIHVYTNASQDLGSCQSQALRQAPLVARPEDEWYRYVVDHNSEEST